jgi:hypothetical protein
MSNEHTRSELFRQALGEFKRVRQRYQELKELKPVFDAIDQVDNE